MKVQPPLVPFNLPDWIEANVCLPADTARPGPFRLYAYQRGVVAYAKCCEFKRSGQCNRERGLLVVNLLEDEDEGCRRTPDIGNRLCRHVGHVRPSFAQGTIRSRADCSDVADEREKEVREQVNTA
jgi:hypothetical protein